MRHLPRFLEICNCFCFVCIVVGEEDCMIFFFTFFTFCHQFSFCNGILISSLTHIRQQSMCTLLLFWEYVYSPFVCHFFFVWRILLCVSRPCETSRNSSFSKEWLSPLNVFGSHFESSAVEAMQSVLIHEFFINLLLNTGSMISSPIRMTPPKNLHVKRVCVHPSSWIHHAVESHVLEDESIIGVSSARLWSRNCSPKFCPLVGFLYFNGLLSRVQSMMDCCCCCRCRRCCFRGGRDFTALWRERFPDACWKVWPSFQRCSNLANHTRDTPRNAWRDSKYILFKFSSFLPNFWTAIHHPRIVKIHLEIVRSIQW